MSQTTQASFQFLKHLAADMSKGEITFPTFIDATVKVRLALNNPNVDAERLARVVSAEPLLSAKLVRLANSAALNPGGRPIGDVKSAVMRVGFAAVRSTAVAVAMEQLLASKELEAYFEKARAIWLHSIDTAAVSHLIARKLTRLNPDEALFVGLVHDIGHFYLLSRAVRYPELAAVPEELDALLHEWHAGVGHAVLHALGLPEEVLRAVAEHDGTEAKVPPRDLTEVVVLANRLLRGPNPLGPPHVSAGHEDEAGDPMLAELLADSADELRAMVAALRE
jgi:putative nucleotidyltransferase with HDIG domain